MADENQSYGVGGRSGRFRTFIIFIVGLVVVISAMAYLYYARHAEGGVESKAILTGPPSIGSVPGEATTPEYARTVEQENIRQAQEAAKTGGSSVATIVRPSFAGAGDFESTESGNPNCSVEALRKAREAGVKAEELKCRGCSAKELRAAGYTAAELVAAGYSAAELRAAGFSAAELRAAGLSAAELRKAGFSVYELAQAGYTVCQLSQAGSKPNELQAAGFTDQQMAEAGVGVKPGKDLPKDCNAEGLVRAKRSGITAAELRKLNCGAGALRAAGYNARELKAACYTAAELRAAGFTAAELRDAGFTAAELRAAGFSAKELKDAGFSAKELREAGFTAEQLRAAGFTADEMRKAGYSEGDLKRAGYTAEELAGPGGAAAGGTGSADAAAAAGLDKDALLALKAALENPCSEISLQNAKKQGKTLEQLQAYKCTAAQLQNAGYAVPKVGLGSLLNAREAALSPEQRRDALEKTTQNMSALATGIFSTWVPPAQQAYVAAVILKERKGEEGEGKGSGGGTAAGGGTSSGPGGVVKKPSGPVIKAGTVMYAVLDTSINSDEKSPILATIVSGPLKGSKLIGSFKMEGEAVELNFDRVNVPRIPSSVALKAVAIDPDTARTALAHNVDNHYLLRFGSLFASSFVSGLASAISSSGSQSSSGAGGLVVTHDPLNTTETVLVALGNVGTQYSNVMGANFNTPPTVTIEGGASIGILIMTDFTLPEAI